MTTSVHSSGTNRLHASGVWSNNSSRPWRRTSLMIGGGSPRERMLTSNRGHLGKILEAGSVTCIPSKLGLNRLGSLPPT